MPRAPTPASQGDWRSVAGRLMCVLLLTGAASHTVGSTLWLADDLGLREIDPSSGRVVARVSAPGVAALAATRAGGIRALSEGQLVIAAGGNATALRVDVAALGYGTGELIAVDPFDDSAWVVTSRHLLARFDDTGRLRGGYTLPGQARAIAVALDQSVWIAGDGRSGASRA